jgi:hypothetical protein
MSYNVIISYDPSWEPLKWAKDHCDSYITNKAVTTLGERITVPDYYNNYDVVYYFSDEKDAVMFKLRWS